jgi:hypothetical protein
LVSEHLGGNTPFFSSTGSGASATAAFHRPLLIIFDRNDDMITALHHTSTYQVGWMPLQHDGPFQGQAGMVKMDCGHRRFAPSLIFWNHRG